MELKDTIDGMLSDEYKERFKAEYQQLEIRTNGLNNMLESWKDGTLRFEPLCSKELLVAQLASMIAYQSILEERASIEGIDLS